MANTNIVILITSIILGVMYFSLMPPASSGYGYVGYHGYHRGASFWYFGRTSTYHNRNIRSGSVGGVGVRGGGPGSGK